jgi:glycine/D-amino acid oxidase-like deaminating enzyme
MDYGADTLYTEMAERAIARWDIWNALWERPLFHRAGFLILTREEEMPAGGFEQASFATLMQRGHQLQRIRRADLAKRFPAWNATHYGNGYLNPTAGWAESGAVVAKLAQLCRQHGVTIQEHAPFAGFLERGSAVCGVWDKRGAEHRADCVLLAAGAWTPFLVPELKPLLRTTGHAVLHFQPQDPRPFSAPNFPVWAADIAHTGRYGFPANADGIVKLAKHGTGVEIHDPAQLRTVTENDIADGRQFLRESLPALADAPLVGTRQCWYGDSTDGDFLIDHHPQRPGLVIAGGDSGHGFKFAPVIGPLLADIIERKPHHGAERFRWRVPRLGREESRSQA